MLGSNIEPSPHSFQASTIAIPWALTLPFAARRDWAKSSGVLPVRMRSWSFVHGRRSQPGITVGQKRPPVIPLQCFQSPSPWAMRCS